MDNQENLELIIKVINKELANDEKNKVKVLNLLETIRKDNAEEISNLCDEEKVYLAVQIIGFESNLSKLFRGAIDYKIMFRMKKFIDSL